MGVGVFYGSSTPCGNGAPFGLGMAAMGFQGLPRRPNLEDLVCIGSRDHNVIFLLLRGLCAKGLEQLLSVSHVSVLVFVYILCDIFYR